MPMELLVRLRQAHLPLNIEDTEDIQKCEVLFAAKLIEAAIPVFHPEGSTPYLGPATVTSVTPNGMAASEVRTRMPDGSANFYPRRSPSARSRFGRHAVDAPSETRHVGR